MSSTAINFPKDRSELDQAINTGDFSPGTPLLDGDSYIASGTSYSWRLDSGETYGRWRNEDPGATGDGRYVKLEDNGKTQVINGGGILSVNDTITLNGTGGSAEFAGRVTALELESGTALSGGYGFYASEGNTTNGKYGAIVIKQDTDDSNTLNAITVAKASSNSITLAYDGSASFAGDVKSGPDNSRMTPSGYAEFKRTGITATGRRGANYFNTSIDGNFDASFASGVTDSLGTGQLAACRLDHTGFYVSQGLTGDAIKLAPDGSASFTGVITRDATGDSHTFLVNRDGTQRFRIDPFGGLFIGDVAGDLNSTNSTISIAADGSASFAGEIKNGDPTNANTANRYGCRFALPDDGTGRRGEMWLTGHPGSDINKPALNIWHYSASQAKISFLYDGSALFAGEVKSAGANVFSGTDDTTSEHLGFSISGSGGGVNSPNAQFRLARYVGGNPSANSSLKLYLRAGSESLNAMAPAATFNADGSASFAGGRCAVSSAGTVILNSDAVGNPKLTLYSDGNAIFAGNVTSKQSFTCNVNGSSVSNGTNEGITVSATGRLDICRESGNQPILQGFTKGNSTSTTFINADGAASFTTVNGASVVLTSDTEDDIDVRERLLTLAQRDAAKDALIQALTNRIATLEASVLSTPTPTPAPQPQPNPTNMIPDYWTQDQRMAAMAELLQEYQANR